METLIKAIQHKTVSGSATRDKCFSFEVSSSLKSLSCENFKTGTLCVFVKNQSTLEET
jgi:hypothetical protein